MRERLRQWLYRVVLCNLLVVHRPFCCKRLRRFSHPLCALNGSQRHGKWFSRSHGSAVCDGHTHTDHSHSVSQ